MSIRLVVAAFLAYGLSLFAQVVSGTLEGVVYDPQGAAVAGAEVQIRQEGTGFSRSIPTTADGIFRFDQLNTGPYQVIVKSAGFKTLETRAEVTLGNLAALRIELAIGEVTQSVQVDAAAATVEVNTAEVARSVRSGEMNELPLLSRNPAEFLQLSPGVPAITQDKNGSLTVGGLRPRSTTYNVDGSSNNYEISSGPRSPVILEAVEEMRAVTNVFSAQYGKGSGSVVDMVMKSGTNSVHGNLFWHHRNEAVDAAPFFANALGLQKPPFILNIYGAAIGGPVVRNRTFFFTAYQGTNVRTESIERLNLVPNSLRTPLLNDPRTLANDPTVASTMKGAFDRMPSCESAGATCVYNSNQGRPGDESIGNLKIDHRFNDNNLLAVRFLIRDFAQKTQSAMKDVANNAVNRDTNLAATYRKLFSPRLLNETVFAWSTFERAVLVPDSPLPDISIGGYSGVGNSSNLPQEFSNTYYQVINNFSANIGRHYLRFGGDALFNSSEGYALFQGRGIYTFAALPAALGDASPLTNFRLGRSASFQQTGGDFVRRFANWDMSFYAQDDWRVRPNLTLNLGLRYEMQLAPSIAGVKSGQEVYEAFDPKLFHFNNWKTDKNNLSPSIGVAWDPTGKGRYSIRGGYRLAFDRLVSDFYNTGAILQAPLVESFAAQLPQVPAIPLGKGLSVARDAGVPINVMLAPETQLGYAHSWHLSVQTSLWKKSTLEVGYLGTAGRSLPMVLATNRIDPSTRTRPNPKYGQINTVDSVAYSDYHGLLTRYQLRLSNRLYVSASYTFSKALDLIHDAISTYGGAVTTATVANEQGTQLPVLGLERGLAVFDRPHAFAAAVTYATPRLTRNVVAGAFLNNWRVGGILFFQSGNPFSVTAGADLNQDGLNNDRPDLVNPALLENLVYGHPDVVVPRAAFNGALTPVRIGTFGRNVLRRGGINNLDLSIAKQFRMTERIRLDFRTEFFNFTNTPRFGTPVSSMAVSTFGQIQSQENSPRYIRLGLKLGF